MHRSIVSSRRASAGALVLLAAATVGCGDGGPAWIDLSQGAVAGAAAREFVLAGGRKVSVVEREDGAWLETSLHRSDWAYRRRVHGGTWMAGIEILGGSAPQDGSPSQRLSGGGADFVHEPPEELREEWELAAGGFHAAPGYVYLKLEEGAEPPAEATLALHAGRSRASGAHINGSRASGAHVNRSRASDGHARVAGRRYSGEGFALWPGETAERVVDIPEHAVLRFATTVEPALLPRSTDEPVVFRVRLDGEPIFEHHLRIVGDGALARHAVPLPEEGRKGARLAFEVEGPLCYPAFLAPVIGPAEVGIYGQRPWPARPDIVVFLADTFRADNLAAYGGDPGLTPNFDRLAGEGLLFRRAWSVGTYTLPAHASMFAGVYPQQVGIGSAGRGLPDAWVTIAEHLGEQGYRTGAVTESVFVSQAYGLDQGFAWWDESREPIESTLERARAFLDADDGRPILLFFHTYRTHAPYSVSEATRREHPGLECEGDWRELNARLAAASEGTGEALALVRRIRDQYRGGAADLDRAFGTFREDLARRGLDRSAFLLFTSDHGEAFDEHGEFYHPGKVWEELARIPLVLVGPGIAPGAVDRAASLVDVPTTLAELARAPLRPEWLGRSLIAHAKDRPVFVFECRPAPDSTLAVIDGPHKVIAFESADTLASRTIFAAFDLAADPGERHDLSRSDAWADDLLGRLGPTAGKLLVPLIDPEEARVDAGKVAELRSMGYTGD